MQRSGNIPERRTSALVQRDPRRGASDALPGEVPRGSAPQRSAPKTTVMRGPVGRTRPVGSAAAPSSGAVPRPKQERKPKPQKASAQKVKKQKKPKDPNRIRFFSLEGKVDIPMLIITLVLLAIGITMMFSASHSYSYADNNGDSYAYVRRQMTAAVIGLAGMTLLTLFDYRFLRYGSKRLHITAAHVFLGVTILMNFACPLIGIEAEGGQKRWLQLPLFGQFQPS